MRVRTIVKIPFATFLILAGIIIVSSNASGQTTASSQSDSQKVYLSSEVDQQLQVKEKVKARYTEAARKNCINGIVLLKGLFRSNGKIDNIEVVKGLGGGLNESAIDAMKKIKFRPARKDGKSVSVSMHVDYNFDYSKILPCVDGRR